MIQAFWSPDYVDPINQSYDGLQAYQAVANLPWPQLQVAQWPPTSG